MDEEASEEKSNEEQSEPLRFKDISELKLNDENHDEL